MVSSTALRTLEDREPHVDSEERVQYERQRIARELEPIHNRDDSQVRHVSEASFASLRSRNSSLQDSAASRRRLQHPDSTISDASIQSDQRRASGSVGRSTQTPVPPRWYHCISKLWTTHVSVTIDDGAHRDHLALERTFLGYLRTSLVFVMTGVIIAQLFRLQRTVNPDPSFGFYVIGRPLSITFISMAILVMLIGVFRFWKLQQGLIRGKAHAGGWEILLIMGLTLLLVLATFGLALGVDIKKTYSSR